MSLLKSAGREYKKLVALSAVIMNLIVISHGPTVCHGTAPTYHDAAEHVTLPSGTIGRDRHTTAVCHSRLGTTVISVILLPVIVRMHR